MSARRTGVDQLVDWQLLVVLLQAQRPQGGLAGLAERCRMTPRTIQRLGTVDGWQPRFDQGVLLLDAAAEILPQAQFQRVRAASPLSQAAEAAA